MLRLNISVQPRTVQPLANGGDHCAVQRQLRNWPRHAMTLAERFEKQIPEILRQWEAHARATVPAARHESRPGLLDSIPAFLSELVEALTGPQRPTGHKPSAPKNHAMQRALHAEYSLEQVIQEYSLLRTTIIDVLWPIEHADLRIILDILDAAIAESTAEYVELQGSALRQSEQHFRLLVSGVKEYAIHMLDVEGRVVIWNDGAERITGYSADEIIGKRMDQFYTGADRAENVPARLLQTAARDGRVEAEGWRVRKDGTKFLAHIAITAIHDSSGAVTGYGKVIRDITERRAMELELQKRADALAESNRRKDEFLAILGHELRNPLAPIVSSIAFLRRKGGREPEELHAIDIIERQGRHLVRLVDDLIDVARITHGKITLRKEPLELTNLLSQVAETIRPFSTDRNQALTLLLPTEWIWIEGDPTRLSQVFANLLHNSIKFTDRGGRIELKASAQGSWAYVEVTDTGAGLDQQTLSQMFDLFAQGEQPADRIVTGLGVGLALVRTLVELHDGSVQAMSEGRGKGSRFVIKLPLQRLQKRDQPAADPQRTFPSTRILVVDDNMDAATSIAELLRLSGHTVTIASSGEQAIEQAMADPPDAILLDIGLPGLDGYEVARRLRADPRLRHTKLIALSGFGREEDVRRSAQAGFDAHLTKPADLVALQEAVLGDSSR